MAQSRATNGQFGRTIRSARWCFTLNNPTEPETVALAQSGIENNAQRIEYLIVGRETSASGTPHLQGFVIFTSAIGLSTVKTRLGSDRFHLEVTRGKSHQAADYCKKEGDFDEYGTCPNRQGKQPEIESFCEWLSELDEQPSETTVSTMFPTIFARYRQNILRMVELRFPPKQLVPIESVELRDWQHNLDLALDDDPDDRKILWYCDASGGAGKTFMSRYLMSKYPDKVQIIRPSKLEDMALIIDTSCSIFIFDIPRSRVEYFQYAILEQLKDRLVFSPKYQSTMKVMKQNVHVICFANELPDEAMLSSDRWCIHTLD